MGSPTDRSGVCAPFCVHHHNHHLGVSIQFLVLKWPSHVLCSGHVLRLCGVFLNTGRVLGIQCAGRFLRHGALLIQQHRELKQPKLQQRPARRGRLPANRHLHVHRAPCER